jgi:hypothetical protein
MDCNSCWIYVKTWNNETEEMEGMELQNCGLKSVEQRISVT